MAIIEEFHCIGIVNVVKVRKCPELLGASKTVCHSLWYNGITPTLSPENYKYYTKGPVNIQPVILCTLFCNISNAIHFGITFFSFQIKAPVQSGHFSCKYKHFGITLMLSPENYQYNIKETFNIQSVILHYTVIFQMLHHVVTFQNITDLKKRKEKRTVFCRRYIKLANFCIFFKCYDTM